MRAPAVPQDGDFGLPVFGCFGVVENALAVAFEPPPRILVLEFNAGVGHCRSGDPNVLYNTFSTKIAALPDKTRVYPGHEYMDNNLGFTLDREPDNEVARELKEELTAQMMTELEAQGDPRVFGNGEVFDNYGFHVDTHNGFYERFVAGEEPTPGWVNASDVDKDLME